MVGTRDAQCRQRQRLGLVWVFETSKPTLQWQMSSNKATAPPPSSIVPLTGDQAAKYLAHRGHSHSDYHSLWQWHQHTSSRNTCWLTVGLHYNHVTPMNLSSTTIINVHMFFKSQWWSEQEPVEEEEWSMEREKDKNRVQEKTGQVKGKEGVCGR